MKMKFTEEQEAYVAALAIGGLFGCSIRNTLDAFNFDDYTFEKSLKSKSAIGRFMWDMLNFGGDIMLSTFALPVIAVGSIIVHDKLTNK